MGKTQVKQLKISELRPDGRNANKGTLRGIALLEDSLKKYGAGRSILIDKNGKIIAGNKTFEQAGASGFEDVIIVKTDGKKIVAVQREDLDLEKDPEARGLAIADNRTGELNLDWDVEKILLDIEELGDLEPFFYQNEIDELVEQMAKEAANDEQERNDAHDRENKGEAIIQYNIIFNSEAEKAVWEKYLLFLRKKYPQYETHGERIIADVSTRMEE